MHKTLLNFAPNPHGNWQTLPYRVHVQEYMANDGIIFFNTYVRTMSQS